MVNYLDFVAEDESIMRIRNIYNARLFDQQQWELQIRNFNLKIIDTENNDLVTYDHVTHEIFNEFIQDAHEFLIFLINHINEIIVGEQGANQSLLNNPKSKTPEPEGENSPTWINEIFQVNFDDYIPLAPS